MRNSRWVIGVAASFLPVGLPVGLLVGLFTGLAHAASPLDGTAWLLTITTPAEKTPLTDVIRFDQGTFLSSLFRPKGFSPSRITLTEEKGRPLIWETLQTSSNRASISWHGEVEGNAVRGVALLRQPTGGNVTYTFTGLKTRVAALAAPPAPAASQPKAQAPAPTATPKAKPKAKKAPASPAPPPP